MGELFEVVNGRRVRKQDWLPGTIPYVTAVEVNNGIDGYIDNPKMLISNALSLSFIGSVFYHPYQFSMKDGTYGLKLKNKNQEKANIYLYLASLIEKITKNKGSYSNPWRPERIIDLTISLPVTPDGKPDWDFMDSYIARGGGSGITNGCGKRSRTPNAIRKSD